MANGTVHKLGTLYCGGTKQARPTKPWSIGSTPTGASGVGNIYNNNNSSSTAIEIRDTDSADAYKLQWVEVKAGSDTLLICDRNIVVNITWDRLKALGYCGKMGSGKTITIDGQKYELFMLTCGESSSVTSDQWDQIIGNLGNYPGLPTPNSTDLNDNLESADWSGASNKLWNWCGCYSWGAETKASGNSDYRPCRGYDGARHWNYGIHNYYNYNFGWRPALRFLNTAPTVMPADHAYGDCKAAFTISIGCSDADGDSISGSVKIDNVEKETFSGTGSVSHTLDLSKYWGSLSMAAHTITVTATDSNNASTTVTYTFTKTNSAAAAPSITNLQNGLRKPSEFYVEFTAGEDPEGDAQTITAKVADDSSMSQNVTTFAAVEKYNSSKKAWETVTSVTNTDAVSRLRIRVSGLTEGSTKYIALSTTDAGSSTAVTSAPVKIAIGDTLEFTTKPLDRGTEMPKTASVFLDSAIDSAATLTLYVCNNANDAAPTWEKCDIGEAHIFSNKNKNADTWAVAAKVVVNAGAATGDISISAIGLGVL